MEISRSELKRVYVPYEVGRYVYLPGHNPFGFFIKLSPKALVTYGIMEAIAHVFASRNISILHFKMSRPIPGKPLYFLIFADIKEENLLNELVKELKKVKYVKEVNVIKPVFNGFTSDTFFFPLTAMNERVIIIRKSLYQGIIKKLREELGSGYEAVLYYMGFEMGKNSYNDCLKIAKDNEDIIPKVFEELFRIFGFGVLKFTNILPGIECRARVYDSFECELFKGSGTVSSHLVRGILAGWFACFSRVYDISRVRAIELKCIARNEDFCEFLISVTD